MIFEPDGLNTGHKIGEVSRVGLPVTFTTNKDFSGGPVKGAFQRLQELEGADPQEGRSLSGPGVLNGFLETRGLGDPTRDRGTNGIPGGVITVGKGDREVIGVGKGRGVSFPFIRVRRMTEGGRETRVEKGMGDVRNIREGFIKGPVSL